MNSKLRQIGIEWTSPEGEITLWMHPDTPKKHNLAWNAIDKLIPHVDDDIINNNVRTDFVVIEGFVLDFESDRDELPVVQYLRNRSKFNFADNLELFISLLGTQDMSFIYQAYNETRTDAPDDQKKVTTDE